MSYVAKITELTRTVWVDDYEFTRISVTTAESKAKRFRSRHVAETAARTYLNLQQPVVRRHMGYTIEEAAKRGENNERAA